MEAIAGSKIVLTLYRGDEALNAAAFGILKIHNKRKKPLTIVEINEAVTKGWANERE